MDTGEPQPQEREDDAPEVDHAAFAPQHHPIADGLIVDPSDGPQVSPLAIDSVDLTRLKVYHKTGNLEHVALPEQDPPYAIDSPQPSLYKGKQPKRALIFVSITLGIVLSATALGVGLGVGVKHDNSQAISASSATVTDPTPVTMPVVASTVYDAAPLLSTPTGIPPIPTGSFSLLLATPRSISAYCVMSSQTEAWRCLGVDGVASFNLSVTNPVPMSENVQLDSAEIVASSRQSIFYGGQPPNISVTITAPLANDRMDPELGPALFFFTDYDKIVLVKYNDLNATALTQRSLNPTFEKRTPLEKRDNEKIHVGDPLWVCYWNTTTLEGFIYVNTSITSGSPSSSASVPTSTDLSKPSIGDGSRGKEKRQNSLSPTGTYPNVVRLKELRNL